MVQEHVQESCPDIAESFESEVSLLVVPGWQGSGPDHWQSTWVRELPNTTSIEQDNWEDPNPSHWVEALDRAVLQQSKPVALVAHSLGCITVAHWAALNSHHVVAAFLVAPPNVSGPDACCRAIECFGSSPRRALQFPSLVVGSENDPYASIDWTRRLAEDWKSDFVNVGRTGHINVQSGHGSWPNGRRLLQAFLNRASAHWGQTQNLI